MSSTEYAQTDNINILLDSYCSDGSRSISETKVDHFKACIAPCLGNHLDPALVTVKPDFGE